MLVFAIVVVLVAVIAVAIVRSIPNIPAPLNWVLPVIILLVALVLICNRAGLF